MKVKSESEVAQSCLTLSDPVDCSLAGSSVHGIFQARVLDLNYSNHTHTHKKRIEFCLFFLRLKWALSAVPMVRSLDLYFHA